MKLSEKDHEKVLDTLKKAYHERDTVEVDAQWQNNLMRDIRRLGPLRSAAANGFISLGQYLWRAAPVLCMLILIVGALVIKLDFMSGYELGNYFVDDPFPSTTIDSFFM